MKFIITTLCFLFFGLTISAQEANKDVTITASGSGTTLEVAKQSALRSATEQAFGAFISSKTEIFNDQIVADQMSSVSSGNIKSYEVLNEDQLPDGRYGVTLKAIVSVDKLTSFVQSKGVEVEIKGGLFALNIKQQLLNEQGEIEAVYSMVGLLHEPMQTAFDFTIKSGNPKSLDAESKYWEIPLEVTSTCNKNMDFCANYFIKTLRALSLSPEEAASYAALNKKVFTINVTYTGKTETFKLRQEKSLALINSLTTNWYGYAQLCAVQPESTESNGAAKRTIHRLSYELSNGQNGITINFLTVGETAATFSWQDKRTLSQIEKISGFSVKPRGVVSQFKHGGYVVYEKNGHGLVVSLLDIGEFNWDQANQACNDLVLGGYSDWYLPSLDDCQLVYQNVHKYGFGGLYRALDHNYWSSSKYVSRQTSGMMSFVTFKGYSPAPGEKREKHSARAVRIF